MKTIMASQCCLNFYSTCFTRIVNLSITLFMPFFGPAFILGCHEWFALRRLITNSRISAFNGSFSNRFLKEISQVDGRTKHWIMKRLLHGTLRLGSSPTGEQIQNGRPADEITRNKITLWCGKALFCLKFLRWKFHNFYLRNKLSFTYLAILKTCH